MKVNRPYNQGISSKVLQFRHYTQFFLVCYLRVISMVDLLPVASFQSEGKPPMLWDAFFYKIYQTSKGAFTLATF